MGLSVGLSVGEIVGEIEGEMVGLKRRNRVRGGTIWNTDITKALNYLLVGPFVGLVVGESVGALPTSPIMVPTAPWGEPKLGFGTGCGPII